MHWGVDGDIILYSVAFAAKDDPVEYALKSTRSACEQIMYDVNADSITVYLTGSGNYRAQIAHDYKGNRKSTEKPEHYGAIKEYMIETLGAVLIEGEEADDALGYGACTQGHGIATLDKDLDGVPGVHYNWKRKEVYYVSPEDADRFFYKQMLTGDATDNIPGLFRMTGKKASKKFYEPLETMDSPAEMYAHVRAIYSDAYDSVGMCPDDKDEVIDGWLLKIARCLWIRREPGQMWEVPRGKES